MGCCLNWELMRGQGEVGSQDWEESETEKKREEGEGITLLQYGGEGFSFHSCPLVD